MKKVLFFVASLLIVTACNNTNNERVNETSGEKTVNESRMSDGNCDNRECEERCDEDGVCDERHDNCDRQERCVERHNDECDSRRDCDSRHSRRSNCRDSRHNSRHCEDRC